jgi:hypothetical protein
MNLYETLPGAFACATGALALLSLPPLLSRAPEMQLESARRVTAMLVMSFAVVTGFIVFLKGLYAVISPQPYSYLLFFVPFRGAYAWVYWAYLLALLLAQALWIPAVRRRAGLTLMVSVLCLLGFFADRVALLIWGSH